MELVITGGEVVSRAGIRPADLLIRDGMIVAVEPHLVAGPDAAVLAADGLLVCPGYIDVHAHSALRAFDDPHLAPKTGQGFTTDVICPDGLGPAPVRACAAAERARYLGALEPADAAPWDWRDFGEYLASLQAAAPAINIASYLPHGAVRDVVMGCRPEPATRDELRRMEQLANDALEAGARGVSLGLIYAPGMYAARDELDMLARVAAHHDVPLMTHIRNEATGVLAALDELLGVAARTGVRPHVTHLKLIGTPAPVPELLDRVSAAAAEFGLTCDQYPYGSGSTLLSALLPPYALAGGPSAACARLQDAGERARLRRDMEHGLPGWENLYRACGPERLVLTYASGSWRGQVGRTLAQIGAQLDLDPVEATLTILAQTRFDAAIIDQYAEDDVVDALFTGADPMVGSDGAFHDHPHPRLYGTAARVLGRNALRRGLIDVHAAVGRMTWRPADFLRLSDRGDLAPGLRADVTVVDPLAFVDTNSYEQPCAHPTGLTHVLVNGVPVWRDGLPTGARPGRVLSH